MSVTAQTPYKKFTAAPGATLFSTGFRLILASDLVVKVNGSVVSTGFTVSSLGAAPGSDVTFGTPMVGGEIVELVRAVPKTRLTDYQQLGDYQAGSVNNDFDRLVMMVQDSQFLGDLAVLLPVGDAAAPMTLPALVDRALKFLAFDALGKAIAAAGVTGSPVSTFMAAVLLAADAAAARTALGAQASLGYTAANAGANSNITSLTALTAGGLPDNSVLTNDIANGAVTPAKLSQPPTLATAVATTSGTSIDFTGIPSWVNEIDVFFNAVSTSGAGSAALLVQLGSGAVQTTGYASYAGVVVNGNQTATVGSTSGMLVTASQGAASTHSGDLSLKRISGNTWVAAGSGGGLDGASGNTGRTSGGAVTLSGALDRIRFTTTNGTDAFDAGSVNILYK